MGYESAPATQMMATHCACCHRPLVDAKSVELGIGPECRKKYGFDLLVPELVRKQANQLVHQLALAVSAGEITLATMELVASLELLGFPKIAHIFREKGAAIFVERREHNGVERLFVRLPFSEDFNFRTRSIKGRYGVKVAVTGSLSAKKVFHWVFDTAKETRAQVHAALVACFPGALAIGPQGPFIVAPLRTAAQKAAEAAQGGEKAA